MHPIFEQILRPFSPPENGAVVRAADAYEREIREIPEATMVEADLVAALRALRDEIGPIEDDTPLDHALAHIETFCAVALRVMRKTNPSKVRDCARTVEIQARMDGREVLEVGTWKASH